MRNDLTPEQKKEFWKEQEKLTKKLQWIKPSLDTSLINEVEKIEKTEAQKQKEYRKYHKRPINDPSRWKKIGE